MDLETLGWIKKNARPSFLKIQKIKQDFIPLPIDFFKKLSPKEDWFLRRSSSEGIHGMRHILRVIINSYILCHFYNCPDWYPCAIAASVHDLRRRSDGCDNKHGERAARWFVNTQSPSSRSLSEKDKHNIFYAVKYHDVEYNRIPKQKYLEHKNIIDILKCADALDRFRLPKIKWWPNLSYLKLDLNNNLLELSKYLTYQTEYLAIKKIMPDNQALFQVGLSLGVLSKKPTKTFINLLSLSCLRLK